MTWEGTQPSTADPRDIPHPVASGSTGGRKKERLLSDGVCLPKSPLQVMEPCSPGHGWTPATGRGELIPCFALSVPMALALSVKLSLSQHMSFLTFMILSPIPLEVGRQQVAVWGFVAD